MHVFGGCGVCGLVVTDVYSLATMQLNHPTSQLVEFAPAADAQTAKLLFPIATAVAVFVLEC